MKQTFHPYYHIDLDAVAFNLKSIAKRAGILLDHVIGVVKDDAYGVGLLPVAQRLIQEGVSHLAVARFETAEQLRTHGFTVPILVLGPVSEKQIDIAYDLDITISIIDTSQLTTISKHFQKIPKMHCMIDTGMSRNGLTINSLKTLSVQADIRRIKSCILGVYTHFHSADILGTQSVEQQRELFCEAQGLLAGQGVECNMIHTSNTAGAVYHKVPAGEYIRPGIGLYGCKPDPSREIPNALRSTVKLTAYIGSVRNIKAGSSVGYGHTWTTKKNTTIATVSIGYGLGYSRQLSNVGKVLINGERYPIVGRVTMDYLLIDVGGDRVAMGDEVVLLGRSGADVITVDEMAVWADTIGYEILCNFGAHLKRHYF